MEGFKNEAWGAEDRLQHNFGGKTTVEMSCIFLDIWLI